MRVPVRASGGGGRVESNRSHLPVHPVARKVDTQRRLRQLGRHLLDRQRNLPRAVLLPVQAQVVLVGVALVVELLYVCDRRPTAPAHRRVSQLRYA